jgi:hypothetical protein
MWRAGLRPPNRIVRPPKNRAKDAKSFSKVAKKISKVAKSAHARAVAVLDWSATRRLELLWAIGIAAVTESASEGASKRANERAKCARARVGTLGTLAGTGRRTFARYNSR